jgi:long-chain acyl-CoA synthetase
MLAALVAFTRADDEQIKDAEQIGMEVYSWNDFLKVVGREKFIMFIHHSDRKYWLLCHVCVGQTIDSGIAFQGKDKPAKPCPPQPHDTCTIMYTSGTSGQPKGVMLSHESHGMYVKGVDLFMDKIDDKVTSFYHI